jgi:hypothetical protein
VIPFQVLSPKSQRFNQRITLQEFDSFQSIDTDIVAAEHIVLMWFILILLVDGRSNTRPVLMRSKIPLAFAFSSSRNKPAFDVRFLAAKTILWITSTSFTE